MVRDTGWTWKETGSGRSPLQQREGGSAPVWMVYLSPCETREARGVHRAAGIDGGSVFLCFVSLHLLRRIVEVLASRHDFCWLDWKFVLILDT